MKKIAPEFVVADTSTMRWPRHSEDGLVPEFVVADTSTMRWPRHSDES